MSDTKISWTEKHAAENVLCHVARLSTPLSWRTGRRGATYWNPESRVRAACIMDTSPDPAVCGLCRGPAGEKPLTVHVRGRTLK